MYYCTVQSIGQRVDSVAYVIALSIHIVTAGHCTAILQRGTPKRNECNAVKILPYQTIPTDTHYVRTKLQQFVSDQPRSSFEKLVVSTPRLIRDLRTMSQAKAAPDVLQDCECKKMALCEPLRFCMYQKRRYPVWHSGMHEAFLTHVRSTQEAIKKKGVLSLQGIF